MSESIKLNCVLCPVCDREFEKEVIENHVNKCLFLNNPEQGSSKRDSSHMQHKSPFQKRAKLDSVISSKQKHQKESPPSGSLAKTQDMTESKSIPLAETMRPINVSDIVGHTEALGPGTMIRAMLDQKKVPNMILWGPPGCGKTSLANVVSHIVGPLVNSPN